MTLLPLGVAVATVLSGPQAQPPAFRAEAYIIPFYISLSRGKKPVVDLTVANFTIVVDKKIYVPVGLEQDPDKPGEYVVSFKPSDEIRDGMVHNIEVKVKKRRLNASFNFRIPIRKSSEGSDLRVNPAFPLGAAAGAHRESRTISVATGPPLLIDVGTDLTTRAVV